MSNMKPLLLVASILLLVGTLVNAQTVTSRKRPEASGCAITPISCGLTLDGVLAPGDCVSSANGAFEDFYEFDGVAGQIADLRVYPIDATMTNPIAFLIPPKGDASDTPVAIGGRGVWTAYVLASTGKWSVVVSSTDLFAGGRYKVELGCAPDDDPSLPQSCIVQELVCSQTIAWSLSSQSCRFTNTPNRLFAPYEFYAVVGDVLTFRQTSSAFTPLFGIYDDRNNLLASSQLSGRDAVFSYSAPTNGFYHVNATSTVDLAVGGYSVRMDCSSGTSGCIPPVITSDPLDQQVGLGQGARVSVGASGIGALKYSWYDVTAGLPTQLLEFGPSVALNSINKPIALQARVDTPCGFALSRIAKITPITRGRAVRH
jgi:hypothetical protein